MKPEVDPETLKNQVNLGTWAETNWSGVCDAEAKLARPTLVIVGTDDNDYMSHGNALKIIEKNPGAWHVQIKDAGRAIMGQYPAEVSKILNIKRGIKLSLSHLG
jgi:pimeloyl-ACP methyl ester carboxylesterase